MSTSININGIISYGGIFETCVSVTVWKLDDTRNCLCEKDSNSLFAREAPDMGYQDGA